MATKLRDFHGGVDVMIAANPAVNYPELGDAYEVVANLVTSRIYGKDLDILEVASSGRIAFTLKDQHALDFTKNVDSNAIIMSSACNTEHLFIQTSNTFKTTQCNLESISSHSSVMKVIGSNNLGTSIFELQPDDIVLTTANTINMNALHLKMDGGQSSRLNVLDPINNNVISSVVANGQFVDIDALDTITIDALNVIDVIAKNNLNATSSNMLMDTFVSARMRVIDGTDLLAHTPTAYVDGTQGHISIYGRDQITIASLLDMDITAARDIDTIATRNISDTASNLLTKAWESSKIQIFNPLSPTTPTAFVEGTQGMIRIYGRDEVDIETNALTVTSHTSFDMTSSNLTMTGTTNMNMYGGLVNIASSNDLIKIQSTSSNVDVLGREVTIGTNLNPLTTSRAFKIHRNNTTGKDEVVINGDLTVMGIYNAQDTTVADLLVNDKLIKVATPMDGTAMEDGVGNDGAGLFVTGLGDSATLTALGLTGADDAVKDEYFKKSITWEHNDDGLATIGTAEGVDPTAGHLAESCWEMRGGGLLMSVPKVVGTGAAATVELVRFGFRINEREQFELYKYQKKTSGVGYEVKRISRWGGNILGTGGVGGIR
jgi:hypothetical protein